MQKLLSFGEMESWHGQDQIPRHRWAKYHYDFYHRNAFMGNLGGGKQDTADHFLKLKAWSTVMLSRHKHWYYGSQCNYHEMLLVWRNSEHPRLPKRNRYMYAYYGISSHCHDCVESKLGRILVYIPTDCFIKWNSSLSLHSSCQTRADLYPRQLCSAIL